MPTDRKVYDVSFIDWNCWIDNNKVLEKPIRAWKSFPTSLSDYSLEVAEWLSLGRKKFNLISGFIHRKSAMLTRKIILYTRRVNDTIGNSIRTAMCMFIIYPFFLELGQSLILLTGGREALLCLVRGTGI